MSTPEPSAAAENVGRNEPCPCGSNKKYKSCCMRAHQVQREAAKQTRRVEHLVRPETNPWQMFQLFQQVQESNMHAFFYEMMHEEGPLRGRYAEVGDYLKAIDEGREHLVASPSFELQHIRIDRPDVYMLLTQNDPKHETVVYDVVTLRPNEFDAAGSEREVTDRGYRVWDVQRHKVARTDVDPANVALEQLGVAWRKPN